MKLRVIITGSTGMVGKGVLLECLESDLVEKVLVINRVTVGITHSKLEEILHQNFLDISPVSEKLSGYNVCFLNMGVSSVGKSESEFSNLTFDITTHMAKVILEKNPNCKCTYVSGTGTDSTEQGKTMWARVKGKTENTLLSLGFDDAYMFRPGYIQPLKGIKSKTKWYNTMYIVLKPLYPVFKLLFPHAVTTTTNVGKAMLYVVANGYAKKHMESKDINLCAQKFNSHL